MNERIIAYVTLFLVLALVALVAFLSAQLKLRVEAKRSKIPARDLWVPEKFAGFSPESFLVANDRRSWRHVAIVVKDYHDNLVAEINFKNRVSAIFTIQSQTYSIITSPNIRTAELRLARGNLSTASPLASYSGSGLTIFDGVFSLSDNRTVKVAADASVLLTRTFPLFEGDQQIGVITSSRAAVCGIVPTTLSIAERVFVMVVTSARFR